MLGKDVFFFYITPNGIVPQGISNETRMPFESECVGSRLRGFGCTAWVIQNKNMDYLKCPDKLSWAGAHSCKDAE